MSSFFHGMQTAGEEEDINENTVVSGIQEKKNKRKTNKIENNKFKIAFLTNSAYLELLTVLTIF